MDDVRAVIDAAGSERAVLFGTDEGGALCTLFAASDPVACRHRAVCGLGDVLQLVRLPVGMDEEGGRGVDASPREPLGNGGVLGRTCLNVSPQVSGDPVRCPGLGALRPPVGLSRCRLALGRMQAQTDIRAVLPTVTRAHARHRTDSTTRPSPSVRPGTSGNTCRTPRSSSCRGTSTQPFAETPSAFSESCDGSSRLFRDEEAELDRVLATVLFTDLVGSTERAAALGDRAWRELVERHHTVIRGLWHATEGAEVDTAGDGFSPRSTAPPRSAMRAARSSTPSCPLGLDVRAGVHTGEVETIDGKAGGLASTSALALRRRPHRASCSCHRRWDLTAGSGLEFENAGQHELKGIPGTWHLFRVVNVATEVKRQPSPAGRALRNVSRAAAAERRAQARSTAKSRWNPSIPFSCTSRSSRNVTSRPPATRSRTTLETRISPPSALPATRAA